MAHHQTRNSSRHGNQAGSNSLRLQKRRYISQRRRAQSETTTFFLCGCRATLNCIPFGAEQNRWVRGHSIGGSIDPEIGLKITELAAKSHAVAKCLLNAIVDTNVRTK